MVTIGGEMTTVKQLIETLKQFPEETQVLMNSEDFQKDEIVAYFAHGIVWLDDHPQVSMFPATKENPPI